MAKALCLGIGDYNMLERIPIGLLSGKLITCDGKVVSSKEAKAEQIIGVACDEFEYGNGLTLEQADERLLYTLDVSNYNVVKIECGTNCYREFFMKSRNFKKIGNNKGGTYCFVGLYRDIPVFIDVAMSDLVIYREKK